VGVRKLKEEFEGGEWLNFRLLDNFEIVMELG
jgi:hypothetical protein